MEKQPAVLLKARFGDLSQLQNHLRVVDGRTVFFFREATSRLKGGERVVVEFSVSSSEQMSTLRGAVLGRVEAGEGTQTGAWIEFPDAKLAKRLEHGTTKLARQHQRVSCDLLVEVKAIEGPLRMTRYEFGAARKKKKAANKTNSMFASRESYSYTEEELAEYEKTEAQTSLMRKNKNRNNLGNTRG